MPTIDFDVKMTKEIEKLAGTEGAENFINIVKAFVSFIPEFGGLLNSLLGDNMPNRKLERLKKIIINLSNDLKAYKGQVDENYIKSDEFCYIFEQTLKAIMENYQEEKIVSFKNILLKSLINPTFEQSEQEEREYFISLLNRLTVLHVRKLHLYENKIDYDVYEDYIVKDLESMGLIAWKTKPENQATNFVRNLVSRKLHESHLSSLGEKFLKFITFSNDL